MLRSSTIPQLNGELDQEEWDRFLYKASRGSDKAQYMLFSAERACVRVISGEEDPESIPLDTYQAILRNQMPTLSSLASTPRDLFDLGYREGWFPVRIELLDGACHPRDYYQALWKRTQEVLIPDLVHDAVFQCFAHWSFEEYMTTIDRIYEEATKLLKEERLEKKVRLVGVGVSNLEPSDKSGQLTLFDRRDAREEKWERAERAMDEITERFGHGAVKRGSFLED